MSSMKPSLKQVRGRQGERDGGEKKARNGEGYEITCVGVKEEEDFAQHIL